VYTVPNVVDVVYGYITELAIKVDMLIAEVTSTYIRVPQGVVVAKLLSTLRENACWLPL